MKSKIFTAILLLYVSMAKSQETDSFKLTPDGFNVVVVQAPGLTAKQLYEKAKSFIAKIYKNPEYVIQADTPAELLRYDGYYTGGGGTWAIGRYSYTCNLEFKDGRFKVSYSDVRTNATPEATPADLFKADGSLRKRNHNEARLKNYEDALNTNLQQLKEFIFANDDKW